MECSQFLQSAGHLLQLLPQHHGQCTRLTIHSMETLKKTMSEEVYAQNKRAEHSAV